MKAFHPLSTYIALAWHRWHFARLNPMAPAEVFEPRFMRIHKLEASLRDSATT